MIQGDRDIDNNSMVWDLRSAFPCSDPAGNNFMFLLGSLSVEAMCLRVIAHNFSMEWDHPNDHHHSQDKYQGYLWVHEGLWSPSSLEATARTS